MVVDLPSNITLNLKLCTLSSVRKVAFNNMVLDIVISNVRVTHELPLLCIVSILTTCSCSKLTREPVDLQRYVILDVGQNNPSHYFLNHFYISPKCPSGREIVLPIACTCLCVLKCVFTLSFIV